MTKPSTVTLAARWGQRGASGAHRDTGSGRRRFLSAVLASCLAALAGPGLPAAPLQSGARAVRVLFIGNSYTYFNDLPDIFSKLAAARHQAVETRMVAPGGWRLKDHWEKGDALSVLRGERWDFVVLQDQSTLGVNYFVDGEPRVSTDEVFRPYADKWVAEIEKAGATPVFYLTWARKATPEDQAALNYAYLRAARQGASRVAPVGIAWAAVRSQQPSIELYVTDGSHPSPAGSYLAACTLYAAILNQSPVGLPGTVRGVPVNLETEALEPTKSTLLVNLRPEVASALQNAARRAWEQAGTPAFFDVEPPTPPTVGPVPAGRRPTPEGIAGTWKGSFALYPSFKTDMVLVLRYDDSGCKGHLGLKYNTPDAEDQSFDLADLVVDDREISFTNPRAWQGLEMRFRGVNAVDGSLRGVVEATRTNADSPVRLLGSWRLTKSE